MEGKDSSKLLATLLSNESLLCSCDDNELLMNAKEAEILESHDIEVQPLRNKDTINFKPLFTDQSLQLV